MSGFHLCPQIIQRQHSMATNHGEETSKSYLRSIYFVLLLIHTCKQFKLFWKWRQTCLNLPLCQLLDKRTYGGFILLWSFRLQSRCKGGGVRGRRPNFQIICKSATWPIFTYFDQFWAWHSSCEVTPLRPLPLKASLAFRASGTEWIFHSLQLYALAL